VDEGVPRDEEDIVEGQRGIRADASRGVCHLESYRPRGPNSSAGSVDVDGGPDVDDPEEGLDVLVSHPDAAMADARPDAARVIGAVDPVAVAEVESIVPEDPLVLPLIGPIGGMMTLPPTMISRPSPTSFGISRPCGVRRTTLFPDTATTPFAVGMVIPRSRRAIFSRFCRATSI